MMPKTPDSSQVYHILLDAIKNNKRPQIMFYNFLSSKSMEANILANIMVNNKRALKLLTSPAGRNWLHFWLDDTLNYLEKFARSC